ncbi:MAG TPA: hypothetical protein PK113_06285, partial [Bacillota bacterium]|nr:hypothetical protein [Bacillota bacterium]
MRLYTGVTPLAQVPSSALNDTNTVALTDEEILQKFIVMYNYIYSGYRTALSEPATIEDLLANEDLILTRDEIANANAKLDDFVYDSLGNYVDYVSGVNTKLYYTYEPMKYYGSNDTSYYLILNLSQTEKADVTDFDGTETELANLIGQDIYDQLEQDIIDNNLATTSFAANRVITLRQEHGFDIYDYYLGLDYQSIDVDFVLNEEGNSTNVAGYDDVTITANQLLAFSLDNNAPLYAIYASQLPSMLNSHYEDVYCVDMDVCDYDPDTNTSDMMVQHFDDLASLKTQFDASYLASLYTFSEFVYVQYGSKSDSEMVMNYYVKSTLQPLYIYD